MPKGQYVIRDSAYEDNPNMRDGLTFHDRVRALGYVRICEKRHDAPIGRYYVWERVT